MRGIAVVTFIFLCLYLRLSWGVFFSGGDDNFFKVRDSYWMNDTQFLNSEGVNITGNDIREIAHKVENIDFKRVDVT